VGEREHQGEKHSPLKGVIPQYEQRTDDVIVRVEPEFLAEQSNPSDSRFIWAYTVEIDNQSERDLTVTDRFWQIGCRRNPYCQIRRNFQIYIRRAAYCAVGHDARILYYAHGKRREFRYYCADLFARQSA